MNLVEQQQQIKIRYLQEELATAQEETREIRLLLKLNKEMVQTLTKEPNVNQLTSKGQQSTKDQTDHLKSSDFNEQSYQPLCKQLNDENILLTNLNEMLTKQRDEARSQALINEQISQGALQRESEIILEMEQKNKSLKEKIEGKDIQIRQLEERIHDQFQRKRNNSKQIVNVTNDTIQLHLQCEFLERKVSKHLLESEKLLKERKEIQRMNKVLSEQVQQLIVQNTELQSMKVWQCDILNQEEKSSDSSENSSAQDEVQIPDINSLSGESNDLNDSELPEVLPTKVQNISNKVIAIPKLDIGKAQKVQKLSIKKQEQIEDQEEINNKQKKLNEQQQQVPKKLYKNQTPSNVNVQSMFISPNKIYLQLEQVTEQLRISQKDLHHCRNSLQDEIFRSKSFEDNYDELTRRFETCLQTNEILINSQKKYEQKWKEIFGNFNFYYNFFLLYRDRENEKIVFQKGLSSIHPQVLSPRSLPIEKVVNNDSLLSFIIPKPPLYEQQQAPIQVNAETKQFNIKIKNLQNQCSQMEKPKQLISRSQSCQKFALIRNDN